MHGSKGVVFDPFWPEIGYRFNHLGLKPGKVFCTIFNDYSIFSLLTFPQMPRAN